MALEEGTPLAAAWFWWGERYERDRGFWPLAEKEAKLVQVTTADGFAITSPDVSISFRKLNDTGKDCPEALFLPCAGHGTCDSLIGVCSCYLSDADGYWDGAACDKSGKLRLTRPVDSRIKRPSADVGRDVLWQR